MIDKGEGFDPVEWFAAVTGILGCGLVALAIPESKYGWILYAISEASLAWWGYKRRAFALFFMQSIFLLISFLAMYRWFL